MALQSHKCPAAKRADCPARDCPCGDTSSSFWDASFCKEKHCRAMRGFTTPSWAPGTRRPAKLKLHAWPCSPQKPQAWPRSFAARMRLPERLIVPSPQVLEKRWSRLENRIRSAALLSWQLSQQASPRISALRG